MIKIDVGKMFSAISNASRDVGFSEDKGFLNRRTGEILFVVQSYGAAEALWGTSAATDAVLDQAAIDAAPDDWVEIPKYDRMFAGDVTEEEFILRFLNEQGIEAQLT